MTTQAIRVVRFGSKSIFGGSHRGEGSNAVRLVAILLTAGAVLGIMVAPTRELVGVCCLALMLIMMLLKFPVAFALIVPGALGLYSLNGFRALSTAASTVPFASTASWSLTVIPMFVLMGLLLWSSGITTRLYEATRAWLSWMPGGLAVGTNTAGAGLAAVSGSTIGVTYALARIGIPEMLRAGYDRRMAVGSVVVAGLPGQLIPPSIFLVIVAGILDVPVGPQLIAGVVPGLFVVLMFSIMLIGMAFVWPQLTGRQRGESFRSNREHVPWSERFRLLGAVWPVAVLIIVIFGGIFSGILTATEAGAAGALGALIFCAWFQRANKPLKRIFAGASETVASVGAIFLMLIGAHLLTQLMAVSGLGRVFSDFVIGMGLGRVEFLLMVMVVYIILGMFMDPLSILLLTIPLLMPSLLALDVSLLWFGVFAVFMAELAILTPPVGVLSFIIHSIAQDPEVNLGQRITLKDVFVSVGWFMPMALLVSVLLILFPGIATWLPSLSSVG